MNNIHSFDRTALVVGAGVAGLAAAALLRDAGWAVRLVERAEALRTGGYKVDARGAGVEVLRRLELLDAARERACHVRVGSVVTADGRTIAAMGGDTFGGRVSDDVEIERGDLIELLAQRAGEVEYGVGPTAVRQVEAGVEVSFSDGTSGTFAVVLGADGVHSTVRGLAVTGPGADPVQSLGHGIAVIQLPTSMGLTTEETTYVAAGRTALLYATATRPRARALLLFTHDGSLPRGRAEQVAFLRERYAGEGWRLPEILSALESADDVYLDTVAQVHLDHWSSGRVGLIGDAAACASPAAGQGTTLALVTAYATVAHLLATPDDAPGALRRAEAALRPFVARNQALGPANLKRMVLPTERAVTSTLRMLKLLNALPFTDLMLGFVARALAKASAYDLPSLPAS